MMISINNQSKTIYNSNKIIRLEIYKSEVFHSYIKYLYIDIETLEKIL